MWRGNGTEVWRKYITDVRANPRTPIPHKDLSRRLSSSASSFLQQHQNAYRRCSQKQKQQHQHSGRHQLPPCAASPPPPSSPCSCEPASVFCVRCAKYLESEASTACEFHEGKIRCTRCTKIRAKCLQVSSLVLWWALLTLAGPAPPPPSHPAPYGAAS